MRAAVARRFGGPDVVGLEEVPEPEVAPDGVLVRVRASTVSAADYRMRSRDLPKGLGLLAPLALGVRRPRKPVLGMDAAGVVEAVGAKVTRFRPGDEVLVMLGSAFGGHAELVSVAETSAIDHKPTSMDLEEAVTLLFGGLPARQFLDKVRIRPGDTVLVNGASGAVGTAAVQLARHRGAVVTGVCSGANRDLVTSLGAEHVIDYTTADFTRNGLTYDVIVDCVENAPFERVRGSLAPGGALLLVVASLRSMLLARWHSRRAGIMVVAGGEVRYGPEDVRSLVELADAGHLRAVVGRVHDLDDIVAAHRHVATGHKVGNVVLRVSGRTPPGAGPGRPG